MTNVEITVETLKRYSDGYVEYPNGTIRLTVNSVGFCGNELAKGILAALDAKDLTHKKELEEANKEIEHLNTFLYSLGEGKSAAFQKIKSLEAMNRLLVKTLKFVWHDGGCSGELKDMVQDAITQSKALKQGEEG